MKKLLPIFLSLFLPLFARSVSAAAFSPLQIGIDGETLQLVDAHTPVYGLRLNLPVGGNDTVGGLDVGLFSYADNFTGIRLNLQSWTHKTVRGVDVSLISMGTDYTELDGIQIAGLGVTAKLRGLQAGLVSYAATLRGLQIGLWATAGDLCGLQIGLANFSDSSHGLQIGLVNRAETLHGLQIGLVNIATESDFPCLPLLRASF